jgi:hypothetical protein
MIPMACLSLKIFLEGGNVLCHPWARRFGLLDLEGNQPVLGFNH